MVTRSNNDTGIIVREFSLDHGWRDLEDLGRANSVLLVVRRRKEILGTTSIDVYRGRISRQRIREAVIGLAAWPLWERQLEKELPPAVDPLRASVVVCTRNRTNELVHCLNSLLPLARTGAEVLVVDNCPADSSTHELVKQYPEMRYVYEPLPGLDIARNRGLRESRREFIAFTDDDAVVDPHWLERLLPNFEDPTVGLVTGLTLPRALATEAQLWFERTNQFSRGFHRQRFDWTTINPISSGRVGAGVNMAIRREILGRVGYFDEALDCGTFTGSGGDQEFFYRVLARGNRVVYEPSALVWHHHRRDWRSLRRVMFQYGTGVYAWWFKTLIREKETSLLKWMPLWYCQYYFGNLMRSLLNRPGCMPLSLALAQLPAPWLGPFTYWRARRRYRCMQRTVPSSPPTPIQP